MDHKPTRCTVLPFLVSMFIAVFAMPTQVYLVNRREMGVEHAQPWRSQSFDSILTTLRRGVVRFRDAVRGLWAHPLRGPALQAAALLVLVFVAPQQGDVLIGVAGLLGLKEARQALADVDQRIAANQARAAEIDREINAIIDRVQKEGKAMSDEDKAKLADLRNQKASLGELRAVLFEQRAAAQKDLNEAEARNEAERAAPAIADPDAAAARTAARNAGLRIEVGQDRAELDPRRGFRSHAEQLMAIMQAAQTGVVDPRLRPLAYRGGPLAAAGGDEHGTHTNPHGSFLLAPAFAPDLLSVQAEVDPTASLVRDIPMSADRVVFNARVDKDHRTSVSGGLTVSRTPQTVAAETSRMEFEKVELVVHDLCGVGIATNRILETSPVSFMTLLQSGFRDEFAAKILDEKLNGTGNGEFEGILNAACTITVSKEQGQASKTILFENVNKMRARQWRYGQSIWLANHDTLPQVTTLVMPIGTGGQHVPIYQPGSDEAAPQGRLLGRPIFFTEFCQTLGTKGDIVNAVWSEYLVGTLGSMQESSSIHVRFLNREQVFMFVLANDGKAWWRSDLTPKYSAQTLSPFVVLGAR